MILSCFNVKFVLCAGGVNSVGFFLHSVLSNPTYINSNHLFSFWNKPHHLLIITLIFTHWIPWDNCFYLQSMTLTEYPVSDKYKNKERFYSLGSLHAIVITGEAGKRSIICYIRRHVYLRQGICLQVICRFRGGCGVDSWNFKQRCVWPFQDSTIWTQSFYWRNCPCG